MTLSSNHILGSRPSVREVTDYYLRPDILTQLFNSTQIRDVTFIYCEGGGQDVRVDLRPTDADELACYLTELFESRRHRLLPYPWFTIGVDDLSEATAYAPYTRRHIGWDATVEFDYGWRTSFAMLYSGMQVFHDYGIHYRAKFSGHCSLHTILPAEAMPESFREQPDRRRWYDAISAVGRFVAERSADLRHGWVELEDEELIYSAPYSVHREFGLVAIPLQPSDYRNFRPWMASVHLAAPVTDWWAVPADAGENFQKLLNHIASNAKVSVPRQVRADDRPVGHVPLALERARSLALQLENVDPTSPGSGDVQHRRHRAWHRMALGETQIDKLLTAVCDDDGAVRWFAVEALAQAAARGTVDADLVRSIAEDCVDDDCEYVAQAALDLLCHCGEHSLQRLLKVTRSPSAVMWTLVNWAENHGEAALDFLVRHLRGSDWQLRGAAMLILGKIARTATPRLIRLLSCEDESTRLRALCALLEVGEGARADLQTAAGAGEPGRSLATRALKALDRTVFLRSRAAPVPRLACVMALEEDLALGMLRVLLDLPDRTTRYLAAAALTQIGESAIPLWIELLADDRSEIRRRACEALRDSAPEAARSALRKALVDGDVKVRQNAARALGRMGGRDDLELLRRLTADRSRAVRSTVREYLEATSA